MKGAGGKRGKGRRQEFREGGNHLLSIKILSKTRPNCYMTYIWPSLRLLGQWNNENSPLAII